MSREPRFFDPALALVWALCAAIFLIGVLGIMAGLSGCSSARRAAPPRIRVVVVEGLRESLPLGVKGKAIDGEMDYLAGELRVRAGLPPERTQRVIEHELGHALVTHRHLETGLMAWGAPTGDMTGLTPKTTVEIEPPPQPAAQAALSAAAQRWNAHASRTVVTVVPAR